MKDNLEKDQFDLLEKFINLRTPRRGILQMI